MDLIDRQAALAELDKAAWGKAWDKALAAEMLNSLPSSAQLILNPIPSCKYRLPCGNCDYLDMPCPVICQPWKEGEE